jgi:hypothetical protein
VIQSLAQVALTLTAKQVVVPLLLCLAFGPTAFPMAWSKMNILINVYGAAGSN